MQVNVNTTDQIKQAISRATVRRNGDRGADIKAMLGDQKHLGVYQQMISGNGLPLNQVSHALRNTLSADDVLSMKALVNLARYGLRLTEEAAVDDNYRGLVGDSRREEIPDKLQAEIDQHRKVHRAREKAWLERMETTIKSDLHTQAWLSRLGLDLNELIEPVLNPYAIDRGMGRRTPPEPLERAFKLGLFKTDVPEKYGGFHFNARQTNFILQLIPAFGGALSAHVSSHKSIGSKPIVAFGTPEQQDYFIPPMANGDEHGHYMATFSLTERGSGTNAIKMLKTEARLSEDGNHLILNGDHIYSTNLPVSGLSHLACNVIDEATNTKLPTVIELPLPFRYSDTTDVMEQKICQLRAQGIQIPNRQQQLSTIPGSGQTYWELHNVKVPLEYAPGVSSILGGPNGIGRGSEYIFGGLNKGRCGFLTFCAYTADLAINETLENIVSKIRYPDEYSKEGIVGDLELVKSRISEAVVKTEAMKDVAELTSSLVDNFPEMNIIAEAALGKAWTSELAINVIQTVHTLWGGEGYMRGKVIEQALRDILSTRTVEGINDVMFQAGAAASAGPLQAQADTVSGKLHLLNKGKNPFYPYSKERGELGKKDARGLQKGALSLSREFIGLGMDATLKHGPRGAQKAIQKQQLTLYDLANREAILFARMAVTFKLKELQTTASIENGYNKKEIAARKLFLINTNEKNKETYPPTVGHMYIEDVKVRVQRRLVEDAMLLKRYS